MNGKAGPMSGPMSSLRMKRKMERLALIKERYRQLIIEPRRQIEMELDQDIDDEYAEEDFGREAEGVMADLHDVEDGDVF